MSKHSRITALADAWSALLNAGLKPAFDPYVVFLRRSGIMVSERALRQQLTERGLLTPRMAARVRGPRATVVAPKGWQDATLSALPLPGVYAIFRDNGLVYIGSATNVKERLSSHERRREFNDGLSTLAVKARYFPARSFRWLTLEARMIHRLSPQLNRKYRRGEPA